MRDQTTDTNVTFWKCTKCGRRYVEPSPISLFIVPPPTTPCKGTWSDKTCTQANGDLVSLSSTSGATCDYVRMQHTASEVNLGEQATEQNDGASTMVTPIVSKFSARASDSASMRAVGEHGRVSRQSGPVDAEWNEDDAEECIFWKVECKDVDCIYERAHCRYQCAMAELDEEPKPLVSTLKRGLRCRWSAR